MSEVVGRLAPSPTGDLHVGHGFSFLLAWWHARSRDGRVLLRIEDLDRERVKPGAVDGVLRDLEWLGLDWDGAPELQSEHEDELRAAADALVARGFAFPCVCTRREIALSAPHADDGEVRYPGTCRDRFASVEEARRETGREPGLRFRCDPGEVRFDDGLLGEVRADPGAEVGDFPVLRRDGAVAYQLAVVLDDARGGVTEVVRGADLGSSTPRQILLQRALELPSPAWWHVPLVVGDDGARLAKRRGSLTLRALRERGVPGEALVGWVAAGAGVETDGPTSARDALPAFAMERVPPGDVRFGERELAALLPGGPSGAAPRR